MELEKLKTLLKPLRILDFAPRDEEELQVYLDVLKMKDLIEDVLRYAIIQILEKETTFPKPAKILRYYEDAFDEIYPKISYKCKSCSKFGEIRLIKLIEMNFKCNNCEKPLYFAEDINKIFKKSKELLAKIRT